MEAVDLTDIMALEQVGLEGMFGILTLAVAVTTAVILIFQLKKSEDLKYMDMLRGIIKDLHDIYSNGQKSLSQSRS